MMDKYPDTYDWPSVSVVILTYNGGRFIGNLLDSLEDQSYPTDRLEILVVDNASTDDTCSIVEQKGPRFTLIRLPNNLGFAAGNNAALSYATNDLVAFLNQDTLCHRDWLKGLVTGMLELENAGAVTSNMLLPHIPEFKNTNRARPVKTLYYEDLSLFGYAEYRRNCTDLFVETGMISGCAFMIGRKTVQQLGYLFDEDLWMYVEDTDLSLRLRNLGFRLWALRDSVVYHLHESSGQLNRTRIGTAARAIMNRVFVYYKNMNAVEFLLFFPFLLIGGPAKITVLPMPVARKMLYLIPFSALSLVCMLAALPLLYRFRAKRRTILDRRSKSACGNINVLFRRTR